MKKIKICIVVLTALVTTVAMVTTTAWAQQRSGREMKQMYSRNYDVNTVETIQGEVMEVSYNPSKNNRVMMGVHVTLKTQNETVPVHLGPVWYMSEQDSLKAGDKIEVTGSRITFNGAPAIVAATVKRGGMTLRLRDENGFPVWRGWRMRTMMKNQ
ncbi:hypothetical protein [Fodinibius salsisoli]|uniref:Magnetosome protein MamS/MamX domain-containing protein n=1 Tax=Fodinibius salsisoli TaxID=2820877 RepID=A0ABT3PIF8_9BACT|nr:hypothetical protein [Fodinibius salsisoli]MCW9705712.1 hypothetical protein [Fodinibius salsisoli]